MMGIQATFAKNIWAAKSTGQRMISDSPVRVIWGADAQVLYQVWCMGSSPLFVNGVSIYYCMNLTLSQLVLSLISFDTQYKVVSKYKLIFKHKLKFKPVSLLIFISFKFLVQLAAFPLILMVIFSVTVFRFNQTISSYFIKLNLKQLNIMSIKTVENQASKKQNQTDSRQLVYAGLLTQIKEADIKFSKYIGLKPLETFSKNFDNFNYGRGYHYFFDLKTFPRAEKSPSYAIDVENRFNYTYRYDNQIVNGTKINRIFNRKYISIPSIQTTFQEKQSKDKNVCHYHLFNSEDKKYHNHRLISKYKYVLKNLQKLQKNNQLKFYTEIQKDVVTHQICDNNVPINNKKIILQKRIQILQYRINSMNGYWDWEDNNYYYFSLDQLFHNEAMKKGEKLSEKYLKKYILHRISYRKRYIEESIFGSFPDNHQKLRPAIQKWMIFQEQENNALTTLARNRLMALPKIIQMFRTNQQLVIFPLFTFNFGSKEIERFIDPLIKAKLQKLHHNCFYVYRAFIKRVLKRDLACQQEQVVEPMNFEQYKYQMKLKILAIAKFYERQVISRKKVLYADSIIQFQKLQNTPVSEQVHLLQPGHRIQISLKELMLLFFYRNISIALEQFIEYLKHDPQILKFMADQNYNKFHYSIAKILHEPEFCILINDVGRFAEILSSRKTCPEFDKKLCFSFCQKLRIAYAWHQPIAENWNDGLNVQGYQEDPKPSKKIKN